MPDFSGSLDASTMYKALSPGNPSRYSFHDIPDFSLDIMARDMPEGMLNVEDWVQMPLFDAAGNPIEQHPITPSDISVGHSLASQFGLSSSGSHSDSGDLTAQATEYGRQELSYLSNTDAKTTNAPTWFQDPPIYAVSDPGAFNLQSLDFNMEDVQPTDTAMASFVPPNMDQYELPMMTDEAVRDWLQQPIQMQDPNFDFEVPTELLSQTMEGQGVQLNYGWI